MRRESKGLNARALAKASGVAPGVISWIEAKHRQPRTDTLQKIAAALEVSVSYLLGEEDEDIEFPVALRRQALKKALKVTPAGDACRAEFEGMCYKDSAPISVQLWKDFTENIAFLQESKNRARDSNRRLETWAAGVAKS